MSIVLPTHNGARYLRESIDSCLAQTHSALELIVVDDGSGGDTQGIIGSYRDPRILAIFLRQNVGLPRALNAGFDRAKGDFLTWTSDDNRYHPEAIATMLKMLQERPGVDLVYSGVRIIDEAGRPVRDFVPAPPERSRERNYLGCGCFLYSRRVYEVLGGYDPAWALVEDHEYSLRVGEKFRCALVGRVLYDYRKHPGSLTSRKCVDAALMVVKLKKKYLWRQFAPRDRRRKLSEEYIDFSREMSMDGCSFTAAVFGVRGLLVAPSKRAAYGAILRALTPLTVRKATRAFVACGRATLGKLD